MSQITPTKTITVLAVEDEDAVRELLAEFLQELGHASIQAASGEEAITHLGDKAGVDLLVTDVRMPGMSGLDIAWLARKKRPDLPIVFVTGYAPELNDTGLAQEPFTAVLTKPFTLDRLRGAVEKALGRTQA